MIKFNRLLSRVKRKLPLTDQQFGEFCDDFFDTYHDIPGTDDMRDVLAKMVMHLPPDKVRASKHYFATGCYKSLANQVAFEYIRNLVKTNREAYEKARQTEGPEQSAVVRPGISDCIESKAQHKPS